VTNLHALPEGWRWVRFGDVVREVRQATRDPKASGLSRVVGLEHLDSNELRLRRWDELSDMADATSFTRTFRSGQVLFGKRRAYQRKVAVPDFDGICSSDILVFEPSSDALLRDFLPYVVQSDGFIEHALGTSAGSLSPRTKWQELAKYEFALPPIARQRAAIDVLNVTAWTLARYEDVQATIAKQREALAAELWCTSSTRNELRLLAGITVGIVVRPADLYVGHGGIPALRSLNVLPGRLRDDELVHISEAGNAMHRKSQLHGGDVVVVRTGRPGDAAIVPQDGVPRNAIDLLIIRCGPSLRPEYLVALLNSSAGRTQMLGRSAGTAQQHLNAGQLGKVQIPAASLASQDRFAAMSAAVDAVASQAAGASGRMQALRNALRESLLRQDHANV
jgi:type I restriction enzyme, S subunit